MTEVVAALEALQREEASAARTSGSAMAEDEPAHVVDQGQLTGAQ
jgi:hypothetical protein